MDKPERFGIGEVMHWNNDVERRRMEYHEQRCAEDALYRRAYERQQEERRRIQRQASEALTLMADAVHSDCMQRVNSITEDACCQPAKTHEEEIRDFGLGFSVAAMMFADHGKMQQRMKEMEEERPYLEEINRIDAQFDSEIIRMSGFEW